MPYRYTIDPERRLVTVMISGVCSLSELKALQNDARADPAFNPAYDALIDCSDLRDFEGSLLELMNLAGTDPFSGTSRRAFYSARDATFGLLRMWVAANTAIGRTDLQVFRTGKEAAAWLEITPAAHNPAAI
jgi:hypothetical protein